jgi:hypothetical protein
MLVDVQRAITVLNEHRHRGCDQWELERVQGGEPLFVVGRGRYDDLEIFEALAIADRYLTEAEQKR